MWILSNIQIYQNNSRSKMNGIYNDFNINWEVRIFIIHLNRFQSLNCHFCWIFFKRWIFGNLARFCVFVIPRSDDYYIFQDSLKQIYRLKSKEGRAFKWSNLYLICYNWVPSRCSTLVLVELHAPPPKICINPSNKSPAYNALRPI